MQVAVSPAGFLGAWGADLQDLLAKQPDHAWRLLQVQSIGLDAGQGIVQTGGEAWANATGTTLTLGRHPFGRVTLYWYQGEKGLWFATRWRWLTPLVTPEIDPLAVYGYACFSYVPTPWTPYKSIRAIEAGWQYTWEAGKLTSQKASPVLADWHEQADPLADEAIAVQELRDLLEEAVARQTCDLHQKTVGILLSGGLDSSTIAVLLKRAGLKVRAYTLDFGSYGISEMAYAQKVAQHLQIPLVKVECSPRRVKQSLSAATKALDLPYGDGVCIPLWLLYQTARQECEVLFNGEGGDQLFAGWTNKPLIAAYVYQNQPVSFVDQYLQTFHRLWGYGPAVFAPSFWQQVKHWYPGDCLQDALAGKGSFLARLRRATLMLKGAQNIHPRATNLALALGLRLRSPFCDEHLAKWAFTVKAELFLRGACEKYILKRAVEPWLPAEVVWREKRGMGVPLTQWCLGPLWRDLGQWLNPKRLEAEGIWRPDLAARVAFGGLGSELRKRRIGEILWLLLAWQCWRSQLGEIRQGNSWWHPFVLPYEFWRRTGLYRCWRDSI
ncbi:MAG: asparagine synthetase B family protein [Gloeomargarita sp. SKYBB_i_bin120]|nr:asparagine synthetase B family protein [Gloeomargarita sp. SKYG98]MCS7292104.1 asparagine synthetase B family protein [Gloeomargarita sp. SKYB120]MDW8177664.1 asparagine synthetase B family protein [Gloeomargarita sp. SKYBB_i_bin120]